MRGNLRHCIKMTALAPFAAAIFSMAAMTAHAAAELSDIVAIAARDGQSCALTSAGGVKCWGDFGNAAHLTPVTIPGFESGVRTMALRSGGLLCALMQDGDVRCQDGFTVSHGALAVAEISAAVSHLCVLTVAGGVKCVGDAFGPALVDVAGLEQGVAHITGGAHHSCALMTSGGVKCWGINRYDFLYLVSSGWLGNGTDANSWTPVDVVDLPSNIVSVNAGTWNTCAVTGTGAVKCWGSGYGNRPVDVTGLASGIDAVANWGGLGPRISLGIAPAPYSHFCARTTTGGVKCWGSNSYGELGDGSTSGRGTPEYVSGLESGVAAIAVGTDHSCALTTSGRVRCWGRNTSGQLGDGTTSPSPSFFAPTDVVGLSSGVASIDAGYYHACVRTTAGGAKCWGANQLSGAGSTYFTGALGDGTYANRSAPVDVIGLSSGVARVATGQSHSCAITTAGGARCWGANSGGALGDGSSVYNSTSPVNVLNLAGAERIDGGGSHTCAIVSGGAMKCWGSNFYGQLGDGTETSRSQPIDVPGMSGVQRISLGWAHTCVLDAFGFAKCWGRNVEGQLGDGTTTKRLVPTAVANRGRVYTSIAAGDVHTCGLTSGGGVECWGYNDHGQIGNGTTQMQTSAVPVPGLSSGVVAIAAGWGHSCAITSAGDVRCWGANAFGQLGDGTTTERLTPVNVVGLGIGMTSVTAGAYHTCATSTTGGAKCWGSNSDGQIGIGIVSISGTRPLAAPVLSGFTVMVNRTGSGNGTVSSSPAGIDCGVYCSAAVDAGSSVTLTAKPSPGSSFAGWSGGSCSGTAPCTFTANADTSVTAQFVTAPISRITNISTRMQVLTGGDVMIAGFIVGGAVAKKVVINAAGPSLASSGIANPLSDPTLTLVRASDSAVIAVNDDWQTQAGADVAAIQASGFQPHHDKEPAIIATLAPGGYTAIVSGARGATGVGLVGVFEVDQPEAPLTNISTRGKVLTGNDVMIAGFIVTGSDKTVVINVAGPSLASAGIANTLANPQLTLVRSSDNAILATNDNWQTQANPADVSAIQATGFQPNNALEPAIIATLPPGAYTAIVSGVGGGTGVGLVGVFTTP